MKKRDTTIKLEGMLVEEVASDLGEGETLTAYVREAVRYRIRRSKMHKAAEAYQAAILADPSLALEMEEWEMADLVSNPGTKPQ